MHKNKGNQLNNQNSPSIPLVKRVFDICTASLILITISPILIIVAILIKLDSKGPIIYKSKRAGFGYRVFDFYKFRSMKTGADTQLKKLEGLNQYQSIKKKTNKNNSHDRCQQCESQEQPCQDKLIFHNGNLICEEGYNEFKKQTKNADFLKLKNDPRITKLGKFLRNTSIDELPQLFNVLKGDMSIVGNRPLPLYEAQKLTSDQWIKRFMAPAGITGLWQVTKRGKTEMSETERKELDIKYAECSSFWYDMKLILKTVPALLQTENV